MYLKLFVFILAFVSVTIAKIPPRPCSDCLDIGAKRCYYGHFQRLVAECKYDAKEGHGCWKVFQNCGLHTCKSQLVESAQRTANIAIGTEDGGAHCWKN